VKTRLSAILALVAALTGLAVAEPGPAPDGQNPLRINFPAQGPIKLDMGALTMIPPEPPPTANEKAMNALSDLRHYLEEFKKARTAYKAALNSCVTKSYTVQEMRAAGCENNDTVAACSRRLLYACIMTARRPAEKVRDASLQELPNVQSAVRAAVALPDPPQP